MKKLKYMVARIFKMDYSNFFKKINLIKKETKKSKILIFLDIVYTCLRFQAGYMDYYLLKMYEMTNKQKSTFLVRGKNNSLVRKLNKLEDIHLLNNKIEANNILNNYLKRDWASIDGKNFQEFIKNHEKVIAKPSDGQCGKGIEIIDLTKYKNVNDLKKYLKDRNLDLLEELVIQHQQMNKINNSSVNTIRIVTINNKKTFFIGACFRIGNGNFVDNFESGGMTAKVDVETGKVIGPAIDKVGNIFYKHPVTKSKIEGFQLPFYKKVQEIICEMASLVPSIKYVGWDIAITDNGPVVIEANPLPGTQITQMPYPNSKKEGCLPKIVEALKYKGE